MHNAIIIPKYILIFKSKVYIIGVMTTSNLAVNGTKTDINITKADTFFAKFMGLMGKTTVETWLFIERCDSIHTYFMKIPIDAVFIDNNGRVLKIIPNLKPWKIVLPVAGTSHTFELEAGSASKLGLKLNDIITLV